MSVQAITAAFAYKAPSATAKLVLLALANYADEEGRCFPSIKRLMENTGVGERAIRYALEALEKAGAIARERRRRADGTRTSDEYRLLMLTAQSAASETQAAPDAASKGNKRHLVQKQAAPDAALTTFEPSVEPVTPKTPIAKLAELIWKLQPSQHRRSTRPDIERALGPALTRGGAKADIYAASAAYYAHPDQRRDGGQYAKGAHRIIAADRWKDFLPSPEPPPRPASPAELAHRLRHYADTGEWKPGWGERPKDIAA